MNEAPETTQFDVNLPKPRTHKVLIGVLVAVLVLGTIGVAAAAIANRTAQSQGDATAVVMPPNTMMYFSLNTHADQLPNFNAVADAWKDSKEAKMVASGLELALTQTGFNWEEDIQPWLGERVALGIVDLGGMDKTQADTTHVSHAVLRYCDADERSRQVRGGINERLQADQPKFRWIDRDGDVSWDSDHLLEVEQRVCAGDRRICHRQRCVVLTLGKEQLNAAINAALDGQNLATSANYKAVMSALPGQNAGAAYIDYNRYMDVLMQMTESMQSSFDSITV